MVESSSFAGRILCPFSPSRVDLFSFPQMSIPMIEWWLLLKGRLTFPFVARFLVDQLRWTSDMANIQFKVGPTLLSYTCPANPDLAFVLCPLQNSFIRGCQAPDIAPVSAPVIPGFCMTSFHSCHVSGSMSGPMSGA